MLAASQAKAEGILLWNLRRRIGCEALRAGMVWYGMANVQHLMERLVWYGMVDVYDGYLAAEASGSSFG